MISKKLFACLFIFYACLLHADVKSSNGKIIFDVNSDAQSEAVLDVNGFGIGTQQAQEKLHVAGNALITGTLSIGGTNSSASNLQVNGTYGYSYTTISDNTVLNLESSVIFLDASAGDFNITLPDATTVSGREYRFKKQQASNTVRIFGGGNIDGKAGVVLSSGTLTTPSLQLMSDGIEWNIMGYNDIEATLDANLIGWWTFDESTGTESKNLASFLYKGTLMNGLSFSSNSVTGISGQALSFDGIDDIVEMGDIDIPSSNLFSASAWYRHSASQIGTDSLGYILSKDRFHGSSPYNIAIGTITPRAVVKGTAKSHGSSTNDNQWHHVVMTISGTLMSLYIDGALSGNATVVHTSNNENFAVGSSDDTPTYRPFLGEIDEVRLYNIALTPSQVLSLYNELQ